MKQRKICQEEFQGIAFGHKDDGYYFWNSKCLILNFPLVPFFTFSRIFLIKDIHCMKSNEIGLTDRKKRLLLSTRNFPRIWLERFQSY